MDQGGEVMEDFRKMFMEAFRLVRLRAPLVHNVTNFVAMAPSANALLAVGASPLMSSAASEMEEISAVSDALVVNIGCIDDSQAEAMSIAAAAACRMGKPWVLDPVGVGLSRLRTGTALELIERYRPAVIRGNASEIMTLAGVDAGRRGVDSAEDSLAALDSAVGLARRYGTVVSVSGPVDCITDGGRVIKIFNGSPMMPKVTAMGCSASAVTAAFAAVTALTLSQPPNPLSGGGFEPTAVGPTAFAAVTALTPKASPCFPTPSVPLLGGGFEPTAVGPTCCALNMQQQTVPLSAGSSEERVDTANGSGRQGPDRHSHSGGLKPFCSGRKHQNACCETPSRPRVGGGARDSGRGPEGPCFRDEAVATLQGPNFRDKAVAGPLELAAGAMALMGVAGEIAAANCQGPGTFMPAFIDALYRLDPAEAAEMVRYEERTA